MTAPTEVKVPDIGDFGDVPIIEVHVSAGDQVNAEDPLVTLESDKATMDIPAPVAGSVAEVLVKVGDRVSEGSPILLLTPGDGAVSTPPSLVEQQEPAPASPRRRHPAPRRTGRGPAAGGVDAAPPGAHAGPSVRRTARELGVDLAAVTPTGPKGRITKDDLLGFLKGPAEPAAAATAAGAGIPRDARAGLLHVRAHRHRAAAADQETLRTVPAPLLAQRPPRHAQRRSRHHRPGRLPQGARHRRQGRPRPLPGHPARVPGQGRRCRR